MRYLIVEKDRGLFLGAYKEYFLFARNNIFPIVKAPSFNTLEEAELYIAYYLNETDRKYGVIEVDSKNKYVNIVDVLKAGYKEYTHNLIDFLPMQSEAIH
jgi:hypothetical protein